MKILLVDDEPYFLNLLANYLRTQGHAVEEAGGGEAGWEVFNRAPGSFDVVLTDIIMPKLHGIALVERIKGAGYRLPVIFMTGHIDGKDAAEISGLEYAGFLLKPFDLEELEKTLLRAFPKGGGKSEVD